MKRQVSLEEISDGRLYGPNDMVRADCGGCEGCSACCMGMGNSIQLDPYDVFRLMSGLGCTFEKLLGSCVELSLSDGVILPNLMMKGEKEACAFLTKEGRCSIHAFRPGVCRLFPLGRYYEDGAGPKKEFRYFLQVHECRKEKRAKVKVSRWLDTPDLKRYERYVLDWHNYVESAAEANRRERGSEDEVRERVRGRSLELLNRFYREPYRMEEDFYPQFYERLGRSHQ